ncbi:MAG: MFS transporter [Chloroflexota bacterium]
MKPSPLAAQRERFSVAIVPCSNLMPSMMVATLGIALPEIRQTFSLSEVAAGSLFSVMMMIAALTSSAAGRVADRIGRKTVLVTGLSLLAFGFLNAGVSSHRLWFFFFLAVTGIGYGLTPPSLYAIMSDLLPHRRGLGASLVSVTYGIGGAIGALLASRVAAAFGWRAAFISVGVIAAADMLVQLYWIREAQPMLAPTRRPGSFKSALSCSIAILAIAEFIGGSVFWSCAAWTPTALRGAKALTLEETGWVMGVLSLANMLGSFSLGSLSDRFGRKRVITVSAVPAAASAFVVFYWLQSPVGLALGIFIFGVLKASVPALVVALAQEAAPPGNAGTAAGIIMSLHYSAGVLAPLIAAKLITVTGDILFAMILVSSAPLLLYAALIGAARERAPQASPLAIEV